MAITLMENNAGFVTLVGTLLAGPIKPQGTLEKGNGLDAGLSKVIRSDNWQAKADIAQGSFTV